MAKAKVKPPNAAVATAKNGSKKQLLNMSRATSKALKRKAKKTKATDDSPDVDSLTADLPSTGNNNNESTSTSLLETRRYKADVNAFSEPKEPDVEHDYISSLPSEMLDRVLSYLVLDHEPDRALRQKEEGDDFKEQDHVLISLAAMSRHFCDHVESFCKRQMAVHAEQYAYKSNETLDEGKRRSSRIQAKPAQDSRVYRTELVKHLQSHCYACNCPVWSARGHFVMANKVRICIGCEVEVHKNLICFTDAIKKYDLRGYMLVKSKTPGPRAKFTSLPTIGYGTRRASAYLGVGISTSVTSYSFWRKDVEMIAALVHGDWKARMKQKKQATDERKLENVRKRKRARMLAHHTEELEVSRDVKSQSYHQKWVEYFKDKNCNVDDIVTRTEDLPRGPICYYCGSCRRDCDYWWGI